MVHKPGFKTLITQIYVADDAYIDSDAQFGATRALLGNFVRHEEAAPDLGFTPPWYSLDQRLILECGETHRPSAPVSAKARFAPAGTPDDCR
jgi:catechol 1,2-dioxygenase